MKVPFGDFHFREHWVPIVVSDITLIRLIRILPPRRHDWISSGQQRYSRRFQFLANSSWIVSLPLCICPSDCWILNYALSSTSNFAFDSTFETGKHEKEKLKAHDIRNREKNNTHEVDFDGQFFQKPEIANTLFEMHVYNFLVHNTDLGYRLQLFAMIKILSYD